MSARILIVEDETIVALDIQERLESLGYAWAGSARTAEQALAIAERERPALVLMDVRLQGETDGIFAAGEIRDRFQLPVVFLTANSEDATLDQAKRAEPYGYLLKPFDDRELKSAIEMALYKHQAEQEIRRLNQDLELRVRQRTAELEAANRELDAFSYSVSHDLRAPLRAVDGFAGILVSDYQDRLDAEGRRLLGVVRSQSRQMGRLIDDLLRFSRLGRHPLQKTTVDMEPLVRDVIQELHFQAAGRAIEFRVAPLPTVAADASLLRQVWINLLGNAIKFSRSREPAVIEVEGSVAEAESVFLVRDNGVGFDPQFSDKLFKVFQRLHGPDEFEGTGIGLSLVQRVIHRHGGRVWATSEPGQGATFGFSLPRDPP